MLNTVTYERRLLSAEDLTLVQELLTQGEWGQSKQEVSNYLTGTQTNSEMPLCELRQRISFILMQNSERDEEFINLTFPIRSTVAILSKTEEGEGFKTHLDNPANGEYSTTVFLSDPDSYEGGELCLYISGEERKFKLPAGYALTYETAVPHCVAPVTKGVRHAAIFWTTSRIENPHYREILTDLRKIKNLLPDRISYDLSETETDLKFLVNGVENKLTRYFLTDRR